MVKHVDGLGPVEPRRKGPGVKVARKRAEAEDSIGPFDEGTHALEVGTLLGPPTIGGSVPSYSTTVPNVGSRKLDLTQIFGVC
jgi:hypothetical protein